ncbi:MAG: family 78 glycoside hydrolase catalytic domain, partial [Acidimicrobiia bacterium]|nr:family 78 glycoside hydrolase catalytic domain [Acidimicrobiia bacterium]
AYGPTTALLVELEATLSSGRQLRFGTDEAWRSTPSHVIGADLIAGEVHDLRRSVGGWCAAGTDRSAWDPVRVADHGFAELREPIGPPARQVEELPAQSVTEIRPQHHVVDFGQNSNGWVRLTDLGPAGTTLTLTYGEALDPDGDVTQANVDQPPMSVSRELGLPFQTDVVTSAGDGSVFEPRHSTKGFRYVRVEGHPGPLDRSALTSVVVHTDLRRIGTFECSDARLNRLHEAAVWSFRGNACEIPTDCPTRERSGWVGDWQLYIETAAFLYDVFDWSARWLRDLAADQLPDGRVTSIVPDPSPHAPIWDATHGSSGWGDAAVHVPWEMHRATGRTDVLASQLPSMRRWVDFAAARAAGRRHRSRVERSADARPHEQYLWDSGWHFGEWLEPGTEIGDALGGLATADHGPVATAYLYRSAAELAAIGELLGDDETAARYGELAGHVLDAWRPSSSTIAARCNRRPRRTSCGRSRSDSSPTTFATGPRRISSTSSVRQARTSAPGSSPRPSCCRSSPTPATSTWPTSSCSRTPSPHGCT